jgi:hypothetical protein
MLPGRPLGAGVAVIRVSRGDPPELPVGDRVGHEGELRAVDHGRGAPDALLPLAGQLQQVLAGGERVGDRLFAPDVLAGMNRLAVQVLVFLHVGQVDHQVERHAGEHLVDVRVVIGDVKLFGPALGPLGDDVARADDFGVRALRKMRQVNA